MRNKAFANYVKRLTLLTAHQRGVLVQALAACGATPVSGHGIDRTAIGSMPVLLGQR